MNFHYKKGEWAVGLQAAEVNYGDAPQLHLTYSRICACSASWVSMASRDFLCKTRWREGAPSFLRAVSRHIRKLDVWGVQVLREDAQNSFFLPSLPTIESKEDPPCHHEFLEMLKALSSKQSLWGFFWYHCLRLPSIMGEHLPLADPKSTGGQSGSGTIGHSPIHLPTENPFPPQT